MIESFDLDALAVSDRFRLFNFTRRDDYLAYLWVLRAMDRLRGMHVAQSHSDDVKHALDELATEHDGMPPSVGNIRDRLDNLFDDGVLHRLEDASRAGSLARYRNRQSVYQFTELGHRAYSAVEDVLQARLQDANLSKLVFSDIVRDLRELRQACRTADGDEIVRRLSSLDRATQDMAQRSARFHLTLGDITRTTETSPEVFLQYKHALMAHMSEFTAELDRYLPRLTQAVENVEQTGIETMLHRAAEADDRPLMRREEILQDWRRRWHAIRAWFIAEPGQSSRTDELAAATRAGVSSVIALLRQITESQRGGVNRSTQLRQLAQWVFDVADEDAAHALTGAAFNLRLARHVGIPHDDADLISTRLTWQDAPGVDVPTMLFRRGKAPTAGLPQRIQSQARAGMRANLREQQARDREAEREAAEELFRAGAGKETLTDAETRVLLKLLTRALEARTTVAGKITGGTGGNDLLTIRLIPFQAGSTVRTEHGELHLPGLKLQIARAGKQARGA
jgi:uncharacterized protein (TIGR02677 family)